MKIGILTFHSQLNYGGVLQCWALQQALTRLLSEKCEVRSEKCWERDEVVVIDRWLDKDNHMLNRGYGAGAMGLKQKIYSWLRIGDYAWHRRIARTQQFLSRFINRTDYHFYDWSDLLSSTSTLDFDFIVVGSDQVWHCGDWGDPRAYLLEGGRWEKCERFEKCERCEKGERKCRVVSYAASFGMRELPRFLGKPDTEMGAVEAAPVYRRGLARFDAISCREQEGVDICRKLGFAATHVVDPTQLLSADDWTPIAKLEHRHQLTCYFLSEDVDAALPQLREFAARTKCRVKILVYDSPRYWNWLPTPRSPRTFYHWLRGIAKRIIRWRVCVCEDAGPVEFVQAHAECEWVLTDSFHSLMFATTFGKNVRVLRPTNESRQKMFGRMEEYAAHASGPILADTLADALASFSRGETAAINPQWLAQRRDESIDFLVAEIGKKV